MKTLNAAENSVSRSNNRRNSRGAAMVEGALIIPILTMFFGLITFVHAEYDTKLLTMWDSHNQAWSYASHGCVDNEGVVAGSPNMAANQVPGMISSMPNDAIQTQARDTLGDMAVKVVAPGIVERDATGSAKWSMDQRTIVSRSWVYCNEQNYNGSLGLLDETFNVVVSFKNTITQPRHR